jgi:hypothetical protein
MTQDTSRKRYLGIAGAVGALAAGVSIPVYLMHRKTQNKALWKAVENLAKKVRRR